MQNRQNVNTETKFFDTDGFMLTDIDTDESVMLIPCDTAGNFSWTGVTRAPLQRNAMKTSNTSNQYSDLEPPWISIPQENWTGGRGNAIFTKDTTRYLDGKRAQAAFNEVIYNGPLDYYSTGFRKADTNCPGSLKWKKVNGPIVKAITPSESFDAGELYIHLRRRGTPVVPLTVKLMADPDDDTALAEHEYTVEEITDTIAEFAKFTFDDVSLTSGTTYYLTVSSTGTYRDYWEVGIKNAPGMPDLYYRIAEKQEQYGSKFFMYEQLQFMVRQQPNGTPSLWMNGDIVKATSATSTTIKSTGKSWATNQWKGARVGLVYRNGIEGQVSVWKTIVSNTSDTITIDSAWDVTPQDGAVFLIVDTPIWTEVTGHGLTSAVTDVHVIRGAVYFCQGDYVPMRKMRWYNGSFEWMELTSNASFLQSVRDSAGLMLYRGRNDDDIHLRSIERARLLDWQPIVVGAPDFDATKDYLEGDIVKHEGQVTQGGELVNVDKIWRFVADKEAGEWDSRYVSEIIFPPEPETDPMSSAVIWEPSYIPDSEPEGILMAIQSDAINPSVPVITPIVDFGSADFDAKNYVIDICKFEAPLSDTTLTITLQESADGYFYTDVQTATASTVGRWYMTAKCNYRYRRLKLAVNGTGQVAHIRVKTSQMPWFVDKITLLDNYGKITRLFEYGAEQSKSLWVIQEGMLSSVNKVDGTIDTYTLDRINIDELATTAEEWNGKAMTTGDVYLLWSWLNGLQRYYNTQLEGKGPDHDEGLPFDRQGRVSQIVAYPTNLFISIDAEDGYSSVMQFNQSGWHEIYRAPNKGERILDMGFQPIYGPRPDRLWLSVGDDVVWLTMPSKILYALQDQYAEYTHESVLVSAWHTAGMTDIEKLWQTLKIMADNLDGKNCWIEADYQIDDEETWHPIQNLYTISPSQKEELNPNGSSNGKKLRYRLRLQTTDYMKTPKVNVIVLECVGRVDIKMSYVFYFRNIKYKRDLNAEFEDIEPLEVQDLLDRWANDIKKLRMRSRWKIFDDKLVYLDAVQTSVLNELSEGYIGQITLNEL